MYNIVQCCAAMHMHTCDSTWVINSAQYHKLNYHQTVSFAEEVVGDETTFIMYFRDGLGMMQDQRYTVNGRESACTY